MASPTLKSTSGALSPLRSSTIAMDFSSADPAISPSTTFTEQRNFLDKIVNKDTSAESNAKFDLTTNYHSDRPCVCQQSSMGPDCYCSSTASTLKASSLKRRAIAALRVHFDQNHATLEPQDSSLLTTVSDSTTSRKALEDYILRLQQKVQGREHLLVDQCERLDLCRALNEAKLWLKESGKGRKAKEYSKRLDALRRDGCKLERKLDEAHKAIREYESILVNIRNILQSGQCSSGMLTSDQKGRLEALLVERTAWFRSCLLQVSAATKPSQEREMSLTYFCNQTQMMTEVFSEIVNSTYAATRRAELNTHVNAKDTPMPRCRSTDTDSLDSYSESDPAEAIVIQKAEEKFKEETRARLNPIVCQETCKTTDNLHNNMEETFCCDDVFSEPTTSSFSDSYSQSLAPYHSSNSTSITIDLPQSDLIVDGQFQYACEGQFEELDKTEHNAPSPELRSANKERHVSFADELNMESELPAFSHPDYTETIKQVNTYENSISNATNRLLSIEYEVFSSTRYDTQELNTVLRTIRTRIRQYASSCTTGAQEFQNALQMASTSIGLNSAQVSQESQEAIEIAESFKQTIQKEWDVLNAQVTKCMYWLTSKAQSVHSGYAKVYNCARKDLVDYQWEVTKSVNQMHQFLEKNFIAVLSDCLRSTQHIIHRTCAPAPPISSSFLRVDQGFSAACRKCGVLNQCR